MAASRGEGHHADRFWAAALALHAADAAGLGGGTAAVPVRVGKWCRAGTW